MMSPAATAPTGSPPISRPSGRRAGYHPSGMVPLAQFGKPPPPPPRPPTNWRRVWLSVGIVVLVTVVLFAPFIIFRSASDQIWTKDAGGLDMRRNMPAYSALATAAAANPSR